MKIIFLNTYSKSLKKNDDILVSLNHIVKIEKAFSDKVNISINRQPEIKSLKLVTLSDSSQHYVSSKNL